MCLPYNQILLGSKRNPAVQVWEKSIRKLLRKICKRLILLATIALCRRTLKSSCQERKKIPSPREQVQHQKRDTILKYFNLFLLSDVVWRSCHHCGCSWRLLLFQEVSRCSSKCVRLSKKTFMMLKLMSRKAAIPVPGPTGGGSLSDWKEAEGKGNSKDKEWPSFDDR